MNRKQVMHLEYCPPPDEAIEQYVQKVSHRLSELSNDSRYLDPEVIYDLAAFIKLVARIKARQLNDIIGQG